MRSSSWAVFPPPMNPRDCCTMNLTINVSTPPFDQFAPLRHRRSPSWPLCPLYSSPHSTIYQIVQGFYYASFPITQNLNSWSKLPSSCHYLKDLGGQRAQGFWKGCIAYMALFDVWHTSATSTSIPLVCLFKKRLSLPRTHTGFP